MSKDKREEQIAGLKSDMARWIESHDLFDVPDGAKYHTAAKIIAANIMRCVVGPALEAANKRADEAEGGRTVRQERIEKLEARLLEVLTALRARVAELEAALRRHTVRILTMPGETGDAIRGWSCSECNPGWFDSEDTIVHRDNCVFAAIKGGSHEQESRC